MQRLASLLCGGLVLGAATGCEAFFVSEKAYDDAMAPYRDLDRDDLTADVDCDDDDPEVGGKTTWYPDADGDGYGDADLPEELCPSEEGYSGYVEDNTDCDDTVATIYPGATETCNELDDDCDQEVDEDPSDGIPWYVDSDSDGYGDPDATVSLCPNDDATGYVEDNTDCDDENEKVNPGADETCNGADENCNDEIDENPIDGVAWYTDSDSDGYGGEDSAVFLCPGDDATGLLEDGSDCDDTSNKAHPAAPEICNEIDDDCDGDIDDADPDIIGQIPWYPDGDGDGFGNQHSLAVPVPTCNGASGQVDNNDDCDDTDATVNPNATEICDSIDNDCDGNTDEDDASDASDWYPDSDQDGFGDSSALPVPSCNQPSNLVADNTDCDDSDSTIKPTAPETCDSIDNDCDGTTDEGDATDASTWYADTDSDGFGDASTSVTSCTEVSNHVSDSTDCDDADATAYPGAAANETSLCTHDADADGYGDANATAPLDTGADCDDAAATINPDATEVCDTFDNDCDGTVDEDDATDALTWYADTDSDGFGDLSSTTLACNLPSNYVADNTDCDDTTAAANPAATETCDSIDNDCDGTIDEPDASDVQDWYLDNDLDGYGDSTQSATSCAAPTGYVSDNTDCNDSDATINPSATESCNTTDDNCDGTVDNGNDADSDGHDDACGQDCDDSDPTAYPGAASAEPSLCTHDADADGFGDASATTPRDAGSDCNDSDATAYPGAASAESSLCTHDADADGFGDANATAPLDAGSDCDDSNAAINTSATEVCDTLDNDCDGTTDENDATDALTWYADIDSDTYGDPNSTTLACTQPSNYVADNTDCDDSATGGAINPGADEYCSTVGVDDDCDQEVDEDDAVDATGLYADSDGDGYGLDSSMTAPSCTTTSSGPTTSAGTSSPGLTIPDDDSGGVSDSITTTVDCGTVSDITVDVDITHTWRDDLYLELEGPSGTVVTLWWNEGYNENIVATFTDSGSYGNRSVSGAMGDLAPNYGYLSDFSGEVSAGTWTLHASDTVYVGAGTLNSWGVNISCGSGPSLVATGGDCDDTDSSINPGATEVFGDGVDNDCDGTTDNLDLVQVDTTTRQPTTVYGPHVSARSEAVYIAWAADEFQANSATVYDGVVISEYDASDLAGGATNEIPFAASSDAGDMGTDFDFAVDDTYYYLAMSQVSSGVNELSLETIDKTSETALTGTSSSEIGGSVAYDDVKLFLMEDTNNGDFVSAVGCGADGIDAILGEASTVYYGNGYTAAQTNIGPSTCTSMLYAYSSTPYFQSYYYGWDSSDTSGREAFQFSYFSSYFSSGTTCYWGECDQAIDMRLWRNNGYRAGAFAVNQSGTNLWVTRAGQNADYWNYSYKSYLHGETLSTVDVDVTTSGTVYVCGIGENSGTAWLHIVNMSSSSAPDTINLGSSYDECSISINGSNLLTVGLRSGTDIWLGATSL